MKQGRKIRLKGIMAVGLLSLVFSGKSLAQEDSVRINLDQAIEIALCDNPTIMIANNEIVINKYAKKEQIAGLFPNIDATGTFSHNLELQKQKMGFIEGGAVAFGQKNASTLTFNLSLPLVAPQLWKTIQLSQDDIYLKMEESRASKIDMVKEVKVAYFSLLLAKDAYQALLAGYNNAELNAKIVTDKYNQGLVSEYDRLVADVQLKNQKPQVINGENAVRLATMQLKVLMGVDIASPIIFIGNLNDYEAEMENDYLELFTDTGLENNSSLKILDINEQQLKKSKQINQFGYIPTLALSTNYGWQALEKDFKLRNYDWFPGSAIGLTLSVPIFDGGKKYFKNKQNKVSIINLQLQRENVIRQLNLSVNNSLNNISTSVEQLSSNKEVVEQAEKAFVISQKRYTVGSGTLLEMNNSETALTQARLQLAQSIYDYLDARANLEATLGKSVDQYETDENYQNPLIKE